MNMQIYVACLASYNNGVLHGKWIDADSRVDVMQEQVDEILRSSPFPNVTVKHPDTGEAVPSAEEWAIHDFDNMPTNLGEYCGLQAVADVVALHEELDWFDGDLIKAVIEYTGGDVSDARRMLDEQYRGQYRDWTELAEEYVEEGLFGDIPEHLTNYLDYDRIAADLQHDMTEIVVNGYSHFFWEH